MTVWLYEVPVTADATSQAIRHAFVQGQTFTQASGGSAGQLTTARNTEKAKTSLELNLGEPNIVSAEYVLISKFIIVYTSSNWYISDIITITGNKSTQTGTASGNFLSSVSATAPITGTGTVADPLEIAPATSIVNGYATSTQIAKLDGIMAGATKGTRTFTFVLHRGENATTGAGKTNTLVVTRAMTIVKAYAYAVTGPTGADLTFDINVGGSTIWSTQANRLKIVAGQNAGTQTSFNTTALAENDLLTIDIDVIGSTIAGSDITVELDCTIN
jgi:hypothetical protein